MAPTKKQRKKFFKRMGALQRTLLLTHWSLLVSFRKEDTDKTNAVARVSSRLDYLDAHIEVFASFWTKSDEEQLDIIVH